MAEDISRNAIVVLVVLTLVVAVIGSWAVLEALNSADERAYTVGGSSGKVSLRIVSTPEPSSGSGSGTVGMTLAEPT